MAIPAYAAAGAGVSATGGAAGAVAYPSGVSDGHTIWCQTLTVTSLAGYDDTTLLAAGFALVGDVTFSSTNRQRVYWKRSDGLESGTVNVTSPAAGTLKARMYRTTGSLDDTGQLQSIAYTATGTDSSVEMPTIPVRGQAAAFAFLGVADDNTVGSATGETGGDWTEAVAEYTDATDGDGMLQIQTSSLVAGPLSGGVATLSGADPWCVIAVAVRNVRQVKIGTDTASTAASTFSLTITDHTLLARQFGDPRTIIIVSGTEDSGSAPTSCAATYEGVACTQIEFVSNNPDTASIQYLDEASLPADGANTPALSHPDGTNPTGIVGRCSQWEGLAQGGPTAFDSDNVTSSTVVTNDVTAAVAGDLVFSLCTSDVSTVTQTHSDSQDEINDTTLAGVMAYATTMLIAAGTETTYSSTGSGGSNMIKISAWWSPRGVVNYTGTADQGSFAYTGQDADGVVALTGTADVGTFAYTGQDAAGSWGRTGTADVGIFAYTGQDASATLALIGAADDGVYTYSGQDAAGSWGRTTVAETGFYTYDGQDAEGTYVRDLVIWGGSVSKQGPVERF